MTLLRQELDVWVRFWSLDGTGRPDYLWPPSDWPLLVYAESGLLRVETEGAFYVLPPLRALWLGSQFSSIRSTYGRCRLRSLYFQPGLEPTRATGLFEVGPLLQALISRACAEGPLHLSDKRQNALATLLCSEVELAPSTPSELPLPGNSDLRSAAVQFALNPGSAESLVLSTGYARRTLERRFEQETGMTLGSWVQRARLLAGVRALSEGKPVGEAAMASGYESSSSFSAAFRRHYGVLPSHWRRTN